MGQNNLIENKKWDISVLLFIFLRGICMGAADIIPGVSGGTIAFITGIYQRFISGIDNGIIVCFQALKFSIRGEWKNARASIRTIDWQLFIPLFTGIAVSFLSLSRLIHFLLDNHVGLIFAFFLGLILSSGIVVLKNIGKCKVSVLMMLPAGTLFAYLFIGMNPLSANHTLPVIFVAGSLSICAMLLPGISGSFLLVFLGQYEFMLESLNSMALKKIIPFIFGAITGLVLFSRVIDYLLKHYRTATLSFITGLMLGSLRLPYMKIVSTDFNLMYVGVLVTAGFCLILLLEGFIFKNR